MKFTEAELADVIGKFPTWYDITHKALTKTPRAAKASNDAAVRRLKASVVTLKAVA